MTGRLDQVLSQPDKAPDSPATAQTVRLRLKRAMRRIWGNEDGTASMEFVLVVPALLFIFMASVEAGVLMTRFIMLDQAVDMTMRNLRLGQIAAPTAQKIKTAICEKTKILNNCDSLIRVELQPISTTTWVFPNEQVGCVDHNNPIDPALNFNPGAAHEIMLVRVCVAQDTLFPTTGIGLRLPKDPTGAYGLVATSAFVNEP